MSGRGMNPVGQRRVFVIGVGMTKFEKPGRREGWDYPDMVKEAVGTALADAGLAYSDVQAAAVGYIYGSTCSGQRALYEVGMTGIPILNVNNACASGSSALQAMRNFILAGSAEVAMAVGFEKMARGSLESMGAGLDDRANPVERHVNVISETFGVEPSPMTAQMFGNAAREHMAKYGSTLEDFAAIAEKNHRHSVHNEKAQFRQEYTLQQILDSKSIHSPLTKLQCSPTSDGSAAAILCSEEFLWRNPRLRSQAVEILGMVLGTDLPSAFGPPHSNIHMIGFEAASKAAKRLYAETGLSINDVGAIECHDCFSANELITYEALGMAPVGKGHMVGRTGDNTYGGKWVVNPSGGLISKGHPIGATGVAQCVELSNQLRGRCGRRQVPNLQVGLQHNIGIGGACVLAMYKLAYPEYKSVGPPPATVTTTTASPPPAKKAATASAGGFQSDAIFAEIKARAGDEGADMAKKMEASFAFRVTSGGQSKRWVIDGKAKPPFVGEGDERKVDCEITIADADMIAIAVGKLKPQQAFLQGKMKLKGNMAKAMKLQTILDPKMLKAKL